MSLFTVRAPVGDVSGLVAGVSFTAGVAVVDSVEHRSAMRYFRDAGYIIELADAPEPVAAEVAAEPEPAPEPVAEPEPTATAPTRAKAKRPGKTAGKDAWIAYAVAQGAQETEVRKLTKPQLVGIYGG